MISKYFKLGFAMVLALGLSITAFAQDTKTTVVQNADGSYSVIEYPVGKEVTINLTPTVTGSTGVARVMRAADGTKVWVDLSGVPASTPSVTTDTAADWPSEVTAASRASSLRPDNTTRAPSATRHSAAARPSPSAPSATM